MSFDEIPCIDLAGAFSDDRGDRVRVAREVGAAAETAGFFVVANHGVPQPLVDRQLDWTRRFFDLPRTAKEAVALRNSPHRRGYEAIGEQRLDEGAAPDLKESYYCGVEHPPSHPDVMAGHDSYGRNQWPDGLPGFVGQMTSYLEAQRRLSHRIVRLLALSLDLDEGFFDPLFRDPMITLRLVRYPPHPRDAAPDVFGAGAHTDWGAVTVLAQDALGGLEVQNPEGRWIPALPMPGTFVVNLGDMVPRWTNGRYRSNPHRVINANPDERPRHSVPFFYSPDHGARIECVPTCLVPGIPPLFPPCTAGEHMEEMYRKTYGGMAA